ncbi:hypothetical protein, partial [Clostridium sp.]|uniref:hypothetical protein n=1 Tax=Clostridium sp. TaxID=1506 RepID=UPI0034644E55
MVSESLTIAATNTPFLKFTSFKGMSKHLVVSLAKNSKASALSYTILYRFLIDDPFLFLKDL